uniref:Uncharacterized protein n=1 Tax=Glossina austeni TaxID=7395 RepID=A0A1A9VB35_GLOAU
NNNNNNSNNKNNHNKNNNDHHYHHYHHNNTASGREASAVEVTAVKAEQIIIGQNSKREDYKDDDVDSQILEREHIDDMVAVQPKFVPETNPLEHITKEKLNDETDNKREIEYKRYSRDYYINNVSKSNESPSKSGSAEQYTEVNLTKQATENHTYTDTQRLYNDCHWTLAAPVRRSCSLKLLSHNNSKTNNNRHQTVTRCASSVSQYENTKCFIKTSNTTSSPLKRRTVSMLSGCTTLKATNNSPPPQSNDHQDVLYKAVPAQVVVADDLGSSIENNSQKSPKSANTSTSDDTDTVRIYDFKKQETIKVRSVDTPQRSEEEKGKENTTPTADRAKQLHFNRSESVGRGSTPSAFKFLQPKRKLIDPSHVMSLDEDERPLVSPMVDKPVIEKEVAEALPSVKALAKAFLLSSSASQTSQTEKPDTKKAKIPPPLAQKKSIGPGKLSSRQEADTNEDATITSDLSSLDTGNLESTSEGQQSGRGWVKEDGGK